MKKGGFYFKPTQFPDFGYEIVRSGITELFHDHSLCAGRDYTDPGYQLPIGLSVSDLAAGVAGAGSLIVLILCLVSENTKLKLGFSYIC